jgi:hypothetical protein
MKRAIDPEYEFEVCCTACGFRQFVHKNAHWSMCQNKPDCGIAMKVNHKGTREELREVDKALRRLMAGDFTQLE